MWIVPFFSFSHAPFRPVDHCTDQEFNVKHLFLLVTNELTPHEKIMRSLELFGTKIMPKFKD